MVLQFHMDIIKGKSIRKTLFNNEWWFAIIDVVELFTGSERPQESWKDLQKTLYEEGCDELSEKIKQLKVTSADGDFRKMDCVNTETLLRIIQSISSSKAETFRRWLAKAGYERIQEIEDPDLAMNRTRALYKAKGYSDDWIEKRILGIAIREKLTDEWKKREVKTEEEHDILIEEIAGAAFGVVPIQHKKVKGLKHQNLRDHMTHLELIFSMLGEVATNEITRADDARGFEESRKSARMGGDVAGVARKDLEEKMGRGVVSDDNYLTTPEKKKRLQGKKKK